MRDLLAVWAGKAALGLSRRLGHGGSSLPGKVALRIQPDLLTAYGKKLRRGSVVITGTNGKTTTARLLASALRDAGLRLVHNRSGANLIPGLASAFLEQFVENPAPPDVALMEVDEAVFPDAVGRLRPVGVVVTNFFRDQLDRYGELDTTVSHVRRGLEAMAGEGFVALNADDPLVAYLGRGLRGRVTYYGVDDVRVGTKEMTQTREQRQCLVCGRILDYDVFYYSHLGDYRCPGGDFSRPPLTLKATDVALDGALGADFTLRGGGPRDLRVTVPVPGLYNVYNGLAALAAAIMLGIPVERAVSSVAEAAPSFGRMERIAMDDREILMALVKNPTGYNQVLSTLLGQASDARPRWFLMALNDKYADGTDISWIWDVDFEAMAARESAVAGVVASGTRSHELALRLKYAGLPAAKIACVPSLSEALDRTLGSVPTGGTLYVTPTYTAMLELRNVISRRGYAPQFWEGEV
ncbi:MAG: DUF1727 domain-containing protein [Bacillota bacterium]|nr:MAG: DUF1727 domain-containing protein [Bacillota bacterium]